MWYTWLHGTRGKALLSRYNTSIPLRGEGRSTKRWRYSISLFSKMGEKSQNMGSIIYGWPLFWLFDIKKNRVNYGVWSEKKYNVIQIIFFPATSTVSTPCGPECWPAPFSTMFTIVIAISLAICIVITTFGNLLVLVSFVVERQIRQPTNFFIASLAVTDVLIGDNKKLFKNNT